MKAVPLRGSLAIAVAQAAGQAFSALEAPAGLQGQGNQQGQEPTGTGTNRGQPGILIYFNFLDKHRGNEEPFCINKAFSKLRRLGASFDLVECIGK